MPKEDVSQIDPDSLNPKVPSSTTGSGAAMGEIADLLIDRVTFRRYRCPSDECRKTFDDVIDLYMHISTHVSARISYPKF